MPVMSDISCLRSPQFCQLCTRVFDRRDTRTMKFDDFIQCCVMLKSLTESFQRMDTDRDGVIDVHYEQVREKGQRVGGAMLLLENGFRCSF